MQKLTPIGPMVIVRRTVFRADVLDAVHTIVDASETIADNWNKENFAGISKDIVCFVDRKIPRKSFLPPLTREKILTLILIVARAGIEAVQDYQGGDYPGLAKDVIKLAKKIEQTRRTQ